MSRFNLDAVAGQNRSEQLERAVQQAASLAWADPISLHFEGKQAAQLLEVSRESVAKVIGVGRDSVCFATSTADALRQLFAVTQSSTVLYSAIERQVVIDQALDSGSRARDVGVAPTGQINLDELAQAIAESDAPVLVFVQWANQEVGVIQDLAAVARVVHDAGATLAVDATAALGFVPIGQPDANCAPDWDFLFADSASWAGSRIATVLASRQGLNAPDTTSVAEAAAAAVALETLLRSQPAESHRLTQLRQELDAAIAQEFPDADIVDAGDERLPQVTTFSLPYVDAEALAVELDRQGVAVGSGSACANEVGVPSHVLSALGRLTHGNVRVSLPIGCPTEAVTRLLELLPGLVDQLRADVTAPINGAAQSTGRSEVDLELDERGQLCPHPVIELGKAAQALESGAIITVVTDDPAALSDVPAWVRLQEAELVSQSPTQALAANPLPATEFVIKLG